MPVKEHGLGGREGIAPGTAGAELLLQLCRSIYLNGNAARDAQDAAGIVARCYGVNLHVQAREENANGLLFHEQSRDAIKKLKATLKELGL